MHKTLPKLFKKTATGKIQQWQILTEDTTIVTTFGQVGGQLQTTQDFVKIGKNLGRKNATEAETQAEKEAIAKWIKQKKAGYVESYDDAVSGRVDPLIEGGVVPMLAKVWEDHKEKVKYPVAVQPKLDGHRCLAVFDGDGKVSLWSRTRKPIRTVPHIVRSLEALAERKIVRGKLILDGELYTHKYASDFEKITSAIRKEKGVSEFTEEIGYHVYDSVAGGCFLGRYQALNTLQIYQMIGIYAVETIRAKNEKEVSMAYDKFKKAGYEGAIIRQLGMGYEHKRSSQLLKMKGFLDSEFVIVGVEEGRGKLQGHCGAFVCSTKEGKLFSVKMSGETSFLKTIFENQEEYIGQIVTVKYQGLTADGLPRFPVGIRVRIDL